MTTPEGRLRVRSALLRHLPGSASQTPLALTDLLAQQLDDYAEVIFGPGSRPIGFMTRGEDAQFTERAQVALAQLGMPAEALSHHREMSGWFEHLRAFLKLEWHLGGERAEPLAACYFRRRPTVDEVLARLCRWGIGSAARELAMDVAGALEKDTVHFVSAAFRPERPVHHKLYFSQWVTPESRDRVGARLSRVFDLFGFSSETKERWRRGHDRCVKLADSTLFLSISFSVQGLPHLHSGDHPATRRVGQGG